MIRADGYRSYSREWDHQEAVKVQEALASKVIIKGGSSKIRYVAGLDAAYSEDDENAFAAAVLFDLSRFEAIETAEVAGLPGAPYMSGFLSFREAPLLVEAVNKLNQKPQALICDGQGMAHPRGLGLASHVGVLSDLPSVGCAKSRLVGDYQEPGPEKGDKSPLVYKGRVVGRVVRTRDHTRPVFVSPGHKISVESAARLVMRCVGKFRLPEPIRLAHHAAARMKKEAMS